MSRNLVLDSSRSGEDELKYVENELKYVENDSKSPEDELKHLQDKLTHCQTALQVVQEQARKTKEYLKKRMSSSFKCKATPTKTDDQKEDQPFPTECDLHLPYPPLLSPSKRQSLAKNRPQYVNRFPRVLHLRLEETPDHLILFHLESFKVRTATHTLNSFDDLYIPMNDETFCFCTEFPDSEVEWVGVAYWTEDSTCVGKRVILPNEFESLFASINTCFTMSLAKKDAETGVVIALDDSYHGLWFLFERCGGSS